MISYYGYVLSPNQIETGEGFLICKNVPIARTGEMQYYANELELDGDPARPVTVRRFSEDVFEAAAVASFEGKPVTDGHPSEDVTPENYSAYTKGHIENVRQQGDYLVGDIHINDANLISDVINNVKREVSCGYQCEYVPLSDGTYKQINIRGNHVAVVPKGRAGGMVSIKDSKPKEERGRTMLDYTKKILGIFGHAAKDAEPETIAEMADTAAAAIEAGQAAKTPADDETIYKEQKGVDVGTKIDRLLSLVEELLEKESGDKMSSEDELDALINSETGETEAQKQEAHTVPAEDMTDAKCQTASDAMTILKAMRPVVASIKDEDTKRMVTDALITAYKSQDTQTVSGILQAAQDSAHSKTENFKSQEKICEEQKAIYDGFNPHKKGGK